MKKEIYVSHKETGKRTALFLFLSLIQFSYLISKCDNLELTTLGTKDSEYKENF